LAGSKKDFWTSLVIGVAATMAASFARAQAPAAPPPPLAPITLKGDVDRGRALAETCEGCHGVPNSHNAYPSYNVPKLGGQNADYITVALQGYRRGTRAHPTMQAQAATLSDQDIADIAAYFATRTGEPETGKLSATAMAIEEGKRKAVACVQCHGENGVAATTQWPTLAGQHESYLQHALAQYKSGERESLIMKPMIASLDQDAIDELAAYFASQPYLHSFD
jgi:cytochrome c553